MSKHPAAIRRAAICLWACVVALLAIGSSALRAQTAGTGQIQGTVSDPTGAVVANAPVTLTDEATQVQRAAKSDNSGIYIFPDVPVGTYDLQVAVQGFETYVQTGIVLEVGSNIAVNAKLTVGKTDIKVEVRAEGLALQTEDATYKQTIDSNEMVEMPLNGRHMTDLLYVSGGVSPASGNDFTGSKYSYAAIGISVAGGMGNSTLWRLDGADNSDYMAGSNLPFPFPDAVSQFSVESSSLGAQDGMHAGGMVNVVTHSGTNTFHGDGFEFIRNNLVDATNFFVLPCTNGAKPPSCGKDTLHQDQYGGTIGGPVILPKLFNGRDKLFFFAGFQYTRVKQESANSFAYVPTAANLAGDFSAEAGVPSSAPGAGATAGTKPNTLCGTKLTQLVDPLTGVPLPGNVYAPGTLPTWNAQALALLKYFPPVVPLADGSDVCGHVEYSIPSQNFDKQFITREDYTVGHNDNLYGRYMLDTYQLPAYFFPTNILVTTASGNPEQRVQTGTIGEDHVFTSKVVNSAHVSLLRRVDLRGYNPSDINACDLGVNVNCAVAAGLYVTNGGQDPIPTLGGGTNSVAHFNDNTLAFDDDLTWLVGRHQLVIGGEFVRNQLNISNAYETNGVYGFNSNYSSYGPYGTQKQAADNGNYCASCASQPAQYGDGQLDFLDGAMASFQQSKYQQNAMRGNVPSLYIQDTFHANKQLTLVLGVRWDPFYNPYDELNRGTVFNYNDFLAGTHSLVYPTAPAGMLFYGDPGVPRNFSKSSPKQFDPNVGFTYDLAGDGKTVIRAGAEYIYDMPNNFTMERNQQNPPFATAISQTLNSYVPFSSPWTAPTLAAGPGAATPTSVLSNPFSNASSFAGIPSAAAAIFPNGGQYIVPVPQFHPAAYVQWTMSLQHDFGKGWMASLQYIGSKGNHEAWDTALNPPIFIPGVSSGVAGPANCNVSIGGTNYWLGEFPASAAVPKAGAACSTTGNETQRSQLILIDPSQGNLIGAVNSSQLINDIAMSTYEGVVVSVNHRLSSTLSVLANYTWSHCLDELDNNGEESSVSGEINTNPRVDYGNCGFDYRNIANFSVVARSAFHFGNRAESLLLNGWEIAGLSSLRTGSVFSVTTGADDDLIGAPGGDRATLIPGQPVYSEVKFLSASGEANREYLNPAAFQTNGSYYNSWETASATGPVYGTTNRNQFHGPPLVNFDSQVSRIWKVHERLSLDTRVEAFNVLNHPSFSTPNGTATSGSFGQVSGTANNARVFQGAVKVIF